ncbi:MAG TPA: hypothetical protein VEZ16_13905 [Microvirga sp.]|nr:hypothetical protein [Microvirga sp.]
MLDGTTIMSYGLEFAPALGAILAAALAAWIVWRILRRGWQLAFGRPENASVQPQHSPLQERREPVLGPVGEAPAVQVPDTADIRALRASIDALTRQIASLEQKLAPAPQPTGKIVPITPAITGEDAFRNTAKPPLSS